MSKSYQAGVTPMADNYTSDQIIGFIKKNWPDMHSPTHEFAVYMNRVHDLSFARAQEALAGFNLTVGEFDILATLRRSAPPHVLTPTELQRSLLITSGGLTKLLYQLEAGGLVNRSVQEQDKRSKLAHLTPKGKKVAEKAMKAIQGVTGEWLGEALSQRELEQLKNLLGKTAQALEKSDSDGT